MSPEPLPATNESALMYSGLSVYFDASSARHDDRRSGAVGDAGAVEHAERAGDLR